MRYYTNYLKHHGIKGQKWGIRRFQNYDGTRIKNQEEQTVHIKGPKRFHVGAGDIDLDDELTKVEKVRKVATSTKSYQDMDIVERTKVVKTINSEKGKFNCQACAASYDIYRRTGTMLKIRGDADTRDFDNNDFMKKIYKDFPGFKTSDKANSCAEFSQQLVDSYGNGNEVYGRLNLRKTTGGTHAATFYMRDGEPRIIESQTRKDYSVEEFDRALGSKFNWESVEYARTDNLEFADSSIRFIGRLSQKK